MYIKYDLYKWEEGRTTKPHIYYNNNHTSTQQACKQKNASQMKTIMYIEIYESRKHKT